MAALVVPGSRVARDPEQVPMFPEEPGGTLAELLEVLKLQAKALQEGYAHQREQFALVREVIDRWYERNGNKTQHDVQTEAETAEEPKPYGPSNPKHKTWRGFVLDMQSIQGGRLKVSKNWMAMRCPDSVKTITRTMRGYGLDARDWPPSMWDPNEERVWKSPD